MNLAVQANQSKVERKQKMDKYLDFARELKKLWNMKMMIISIVIAALGTVMKGLIQGLEGLEMIGRMDTIPTIALLRSARILRRVLERRLAVTQTPVKDHQLMLMWKTFKE